MRLVGEYCIIMPGNEIDRRPFYFAEVREETPIICLYKPPADFSVVYETQRLSKTRGKYT